MRRIRTAALSALILLSSAATVLAQEGSASEETADKGPSPQDRAMAEALFREGKKLGEEGRIPEACKKFKESQRLDPTLGTLLHLAACYAEEGKTASAWAAFNAAADMAQRSKQKEREELARERANELEGKLSRLTVTVALAHDGLVVELDGSVLGEGTLGTALPIDPGGHVLKASAPGKREWSQQFEVASEPATQNIEVPRLEDVPVEAPPVAPPKPAERPAPAPEASSSKRTIGFVLGGVGLVSIGVGSYFGLHAKSQADDADRFCRGSVCTEEGLSGHEDARSSAFIANILFGVGVVGLVSGTYLVVTSGPDKAPQSASPARGERRQTRPSLWVRAGVGQVAAGGSF
jgi:hypothetical protein